MPERAGPGHRVQDPRRARGEAAQGALLPRTPGPEVQGQDGAGAVRLPRGDRPEEGGGRSDEEKQAEQGGDGHLV